MKAFFKGSKAKISAAIAAGGLVTSNAMAAATLTAPTFALDDVAVVAGALLVGLAGFWAIKKGVGLAK
jgi:uncharacterized protein YaiE (UPF0345 family)